MGLFGTLFARPDMNAGLKKYSETQGAVLLDVRTDAEFAQGHIPGASNLPVDRIFGAQKKIGSFDTPVYVYCQSGARSARAADWLRSAGYKNITNLGGIISYEGKVQKGRN
jgi:Rhodanese-related sulfurtransferase